MNPDLSLIIPTYNERANIEKLLMRIFSVFREHTINGEIIIVDDNSPDGTAETINLMMGTHPELHLVSRNGKLGLSSAVLAGFEAAKGTMLAVMDADLSHPPEKIPEMMRAFRDGNADLVIGSRYIPGGKIEGWGWYRRLQSWGATIISRLFTDVRDTMTGFFIIRRDCLPREPINPKGFKILLELIVKSSAKKIVEVPITFTNRTLGKSKAGGREIFWYLGNVIGYMSRSRKIGSLLFKFGVVGVGGMIVNLLALYSFTEFSGIHYLSSAILAFLLAVIFNFLLNKIWTFREPLRHDLARRYFKFFIVSVAALAVNLASLYVLVEYFGMWYVFAQIVSIAIAFLVNFVGNYLWAFRI